MSYQCNGLPPTCRVDMPRISTWSEKGGECADIPGKRGSLNQKTYVTPYGVTYYEPGVTVSEFNHRALRLPQKRDFLGAEFYNAGCATLYGRSNFDPSLPNSARNLNTESEEMYQSLWMPQPYFTTNNPPCECNGIKCDSYNGPKGWVMDKNGVLAWQKQVAQ